MIRATMLAALLASAARFGAAGVPEGESGIASKYPDDAGIANDPAVVMFLDYESDAWRRGWKGSSMKPYSLTTDPENVFRGRSSLQETLRPDGPRPTITYDFAQGRRYERLHTRFYVRFDRNFRTKSNLKFSGFGAVPPGKPTWWAIGRAGIKPTGYDKCYGIVGMTPELKPYFYYYHADQRGGYGSFKRFAPALERGRWHCIEVMLKLNDAAGRDGEIRCWLDGEMIGEVTGLRWRLTPKLQIAVLADQGYVNKGVDGVQRFWIDNRVVATEYIGPIAHAKTGGILWRSPRRTGSCSGRRGARTTGSFSGTTPCTPHAGRPTGSTTRPGRSWGGSGAAPVAPGRPAASTAY